MLDDVLDRADRKAEITSLIPIANEHLFTGRIEVEATIRLDEDDKSKIVKAYRGKGYVIDVTTMDHELEVSVRYDFNSSVFVEGKFASYWTGVNYGYRKSSSRSPKWNRLDTSTSEEKTVWNVAVDVIRDELPQIVYFPTFLVDIPSRIYLSGAEADKPKNKYYYNVLQNIASSVDSRIDLKEHVAQRMENFRAEDGTPQWVQNLLGSPSRRAINAVFNQMSTIVSKRILSSWRDVIGKSANIERISFEWGVDAEKDNSPYVTFTISDGESDYEVGHRSLGFRWFFSFLLFTTFGGSSGRKKLFLFDEPAANLHVKAQSQLLNSFSYLIERGDKIIYSTHSAHMIEPKWLSGAHIVDNLAINFDESDGVGDFSSVPTNIRAIPYRRFVSSYPQRTNYFQPVIETLQHQSPAVVMERPGLIVEGPTDFYALSYVGRAYNLKIDFDIVPAESASRCAPLIGWYLGRGVPFRVLLDDDKAGREARDRYIKEWHLPEGSVVTLGDVEPSLIGKALEGALSSDTRDLVAAKYGEANKKAIGAYLAEASAVQERGWLAATDVELLSKLLVQARPD